MAKRLKGPYILALILFHVLQVEALIIRTAALPENSLPTPTSASLTTPPVSTKSSSTNTPLATTSESSSGIRLYLPLSTNAPDPTGFSQVSGFYGPGAWAGWFITIVASWYRIYREDEGNIDPNTWLYLLGTNWAGLDFIRHVLKARALGGSSTTEGNKEMAQLGAAFNVLWWGSVHGFFQSVWWKIKLNTARKGTRGFFTVVTGLVLPMASLTIALFIANDYRMPALYWEGVEENLSIYCRILVLIVGPAAFLFSTMFYLYRWWPFYKSLRPWVFSKVSLVWPELQLPDVLFSNRIVACIWDDICPIFMSICMLWCTSIMWLAVTLLTILSMFYICSAYTPWGGINISQSCYFMPCAPQSISESDQAFALLAGLVSFIGIEIAPGLLEKARSAWASRRLFEQEIRRRIDIELARRTNSGLGSQRPN